ncbi:TIGR04028 family ABC transporter substrate-binding protein [Devosia sp.]|uniref:TIGR04028 family ABC transporter substrate-binding protein n=1 Tax=Devosia sp. TaxID=1871048 RepID=UPI001AC45E41|nr:TIGR04028 family ABC transporter substrate-binding protein [Devosia sp.]MBN9333734.1 TIGR04028 family ABC transporter substrate-binding protein [Devosia sp.]
MTFSSFITRRTALKLAGATALSATLAFGAMAQDAPVTGGTLVYLEQQAHTNLYPPSGGFYPNSGILNQITDKLTWQNPKTLAVEPWIAESWEVSDDAKVYTFKIRPGVTFSDGTPVDAASVAKNFDTYGLGNKELGYPVSEVINNYDHSEVVDDLTVRFYFKASAPGFLQGTAVIGSGLVSPATLELPFNDLGDATKIVGSGAFTVASETLGQSLTLKAREDYDWAPASFAHQGRAYLDEIQYIVTPEDSVRIGALLAGQADIIRQVQAYDEAQVESVGYNVISAPTRGVNNNVSFRPDNPLVADVRVRKALTHATNTDEIVSTLFSSHYPKATSVIASTALGYVDLSKELTFDPDQAKTLLDAAGWVVGVDGIREKDGAKLELNVYESLPQPQNRATLQLLSQQWANVGVKLNVLAGDSGSAATDNLDPAKTPLRPAMVGRADPDVIKSNFYPKNRDALLQKGGLSDKVQSFVDADLNALLEKIASEPNAEKRLGLAGDAQRYLLDQAYVIPIFEEPQVFAGAPYVHDVSFDAVARPSFYNTWLSPR